MRLEDICVVVTSHNDADTIRGCLDSVARFGAAVVVDAFSTDRTTEIAREAGAVVYSRPLRDAAEQKNWAVTRSPSRWVLCLEASETLDEPLPEEIVRADAEAAGGYRIRVQNHYLGKVMTSRAASWGDAVRLFARDGGRFVADRSDPTGACVVLQGEVGTMEGVVTRREFRDVHLHLAAINRETTQEATRYVDGGGRLAPARMWLQPVSRFWRLYLAQGGMRDGARGLMFCLLRAYAALITYAKAWELRAAKRGDDDAQGRDAA